MNCTMKHACSPKRPAFAFWLRRGSLHSLRSREGCGPGRTRTCNQTVMSGGIMDAFVDFAVFSFEFDRVRCFLFRSFLVRNWCGDRVGADRRALHNAEEADVCRGGQLCSPLLRASFGQRELKRSHSGHAIKQQPVWGEHEKALRRLAEARPISALDYFRPNRTVRIVSENYRQQATSRRGKCHCFWSTSTGNLSALIWPFRSVQKQST
jgi:hypothetical protein